ncbi:agmatine deiminase family protein [Desulfobulbus alkaliphilus]|uniref:agmatine deiminase family protein n=1 Tax=Desulfobulbus alkaliphilus TaxID=869814 RepID=UPI001965B794|nr:agmatine deiminase family protein [Desulfobulbus alkaliphilus]MBM9535797.1 agmatine deiminase family protein [Desulfobulbus alkaliphilus]
MNIRLPAEWEKQDGVLLAWPHATSDWHDLLETVEPVFVAITRAISQFEQVLIVAPEIEAIRTRLIKDGVDLQRVRLYPVPTNDTWARDFGAITVLESEIPVLMDFGFNAWGLKFAAYLDNQITATLARSGAFGRCEVRTLGLILEGGSIESNGAGTLLTTSQCLLHPNRNPHLNRSAIEKALADLLGAFHILWLESGSLVGDDTDAHIDTLARFCPNDTIAYVRCDDPADEHYAPLKAMESELRAFRTPSGHPYRLVPLPWPSPCYDANGQRLPATYANFLIINGAVLVPVYQDDQDAKALEILAQVFPDRTVIAIDCGPLIHQHGSLHCVTMQIPRGVLP